MRINMFIHKGTLFMLTGGESCYTFLCIIYHTAEVTKHWNEYNGAFGMQLNWQAI